MHDYDNEHGRLPPAVVYGEDGKPLYSWRVLLLPYLEEDKLYKEFHLDEPWDSPHNIELVPRMPAVYAPPPGKRWKVPPGHTVMHVFVGRGAAFEDHVTVRIQGGFPDGTSNTFLVVEAGEPVPWSAPQELIYDPNGPLPDMPCLFSNGFRAGLADGSMRWVSKDASEATLRAAITRNGNDKFGPDW